MCVMDSDTEAEYTSGGHSYQQWQDWQKVKRNRITDGYREGHSVGEEAALQEGFNAGYTHSVQLAYHMAKMRGHLCAYLCQQMDQSEQDPLKQAAQNLVENLSTLEEKLAKIRSETSLLNNIKAKVEGDYIEGKENVVGDQKTKQDESVESGVKQDASDMGCCSQGDGGCCGEGKDSGTGCVEDSCESGASRTINAKDSTSILDSVRNEMQNLEKDYKKLMSNLKLDPVI